MRHRLIFLILLALSAIAQFSCSGSNQSAGKQAQGAGSTILFGATFNNTTSRDLFPSLALPMNRTWKRHYPGIAPEFTGAGIFSTDFKRGINCVKFQEQNQPDEWWAKDSIGRVIAIQWNDQSGNLVIPQNMENTYYYKAEGAALGQTWSVGAGIDQVTWEIIATNATAPRTGISDCTLHRATFSFGGQLWYVWWSAENGHIESSSSLTITSDPNENYYYVSNPAG